VPNTTRELTATNRRRRVFLTTGQVPRFL
jgi:hypothetical protein